MFTHQKTLDVINAGLKALDRKELDGIPQAQPDHYRCCVLGCAYEARLGVTTHTDGSSTAEITFPTREQRDKVLAAWRAEGVECWEDGRAFTILFDGGLKEWMRAFDGGEWTQLVDPTAEPYEFNTVAPDDLPPVAA